MPHKFNTSRRHKFAKKKYRVTNWCGYNESLRNRGDLTVWITGDARKHWAAPRRRSRGGQPRYSDLAITMCLTLGMVYRLPLRQTQGLIRSISKLMLLEISVPDFSTLSRRGRGLSLPARPKIKITDPVHLAIDSTGLKVFDEGEWLQSKYNVKAKRKRWRKLHLGLNLVTGDIVCSDLTLDDVGDPTVLPDLLNQIGTPVSRFIADGAYDGAPTSDLLKASPLTIESFGQEACDSSCLGGCVMANVLLDLRVRFKTLMEDGLCAAARQNAFAEPCDSSAVGKEGA